MNIFRQQRGTLALVTKRDSTIFQRCFYLEPPWLGIKMKLSIKLKITFIFVLCNSVNSDKG
jgi:hypothetical protein